MKILKNLILVINLLFIGTRGIYINRSTDDNSIDTCSLPDNLVKEIDSYEETVNGIVNTAINGSFKGFTWKELEIFVDKFGCRFTGTQNLENSINYMLEKSKNLSLENVHGEPVMVPQWVR